jgi:hypothetical protein
MVLIVGGLAVWIAVHASGHASGGSARALPGDYDSLYMEHTPTPKVEVPR